MIVVTDGGAVDDAVRVLTADWRIPCVLRTAAELFGQREVPPDVTRRIVADITAKCRGATHFAVLPLRETVAVAVAASIDRTFASHPSSRPR